MLAADQIPVAMVFLKEEIKIAHYKCARQPENLNRRGWKICHIDRVGIGYKGIRTNIPIDDLKEHFRKYMSPENMFLVPKVWSGLGDMPKMLQPRELRSDRGNHSRGCGPAAVRSFGLISVIELGASPGRQTSRH